MGDSSTPVGDHVDGLLRGHQRYITDSVVWATAETTTPDLAAIAALDAYLTACGVAAVAVEEVARCPSTSARS